MHADLSPWLRYMELVEYNAAGRSIVRENGWLPGVGAALEYEWERLAMFARDLGQPLCRRRAAGEQVVFSLSGADNMLPFHREFAPGLWMLALHGHSFGMQPAAIFALL